MAIDPITAFRSDKSAVQGAVDSRCVDIGEEAGCVTLVFVPDNDDVSCEAVAAKPDVFTKKIIVGTTVKVTLDCPPATPPASS